MRLFLNQISPISGWKIERPRQSFPGFQMRRKVALRRGIRCGLRKLALILRQKMSVTLKLRCAIMKSETVSERKSGRVTLIANPLATMEGWQTKPQCPHPDIYTAVCIAP